MLNFPPWVYCGIWHRNLMQGYTFLKTIGWNVMKGKKVFRKFWYFPGIWWPSKLVLFQILLLWLNKPKNRIPCKNLSRIEGFPVDFSSFLEIWEQFLYFYQFVARKRPPIRGYVRKNRKTFYCNFGILKPCSIK